jgi:hypothetical protein
MEDDGGDALALPAGGTLAEAVVEFGLGITLYAQWPSRTASGTELAGHEEQPRFAGEQQVIEYGLGNVKGCLGVDRENRISSMASIRNSCIVYDYIQGRVAQRFRELSDGSGI